VASCWQKTGDECTCITVDVVGSTAEEQRRNGPRTRRDDVCSVCCQSPTHHRCQRYASLITLHCSQRHCREVLFVPRTQARHQPPSRRRRKPGVDLLTDTIRRRMHYNMCGGRHSSL